MKKILALVISIITLSFLVSCGTDEVTVETNEDGYVVVNGEITDILA